MINNLQKRKKELEAEIRKCMNAEDGKEHFSKSSWNLRGQHCKGELKGIEFATEEIIKIVEDVNKYSEEGGCFELVEEIKRKIKGEE